MPLPVQPHPFRPLTDAEFALLERNLPPAEGRPGRPARDRRRVLDAIFWVACTRGPWKDLPAEYGRADTASRTLRRWARTGHLDLLLTHVAYRRRRDRLWCALAWRVARAWRRVSRVVALSQLMLAKRLGVLAALPAAPEHLPDPGLSETVQARIVVALRAVRDQPPGVFAAFARMLAQASGRPRLWRLR